MRDKALDRTCRRNKIRMTKDRILFNVMGYSIITLLAIACVVPFWLLIVASFTKESAILRYGYGFWPKEFSLEAYKMVFKGTAIFKAYAVSTVITIVGTATGLTLMLMAAYVLQRQDFRLRNHIAFFFYFTSLFSGGMVAYYITISRVLKLSDTYWSILLPTLCTPWLIILLRTFIQTLPATLTESAKIDGASDFRILFQIIAPLALPGLATIGLFLALSYWNGWYNASLFLSQKSMWPLQYYLQNIINNTRQMLELSSMGVSTGAMDLPTESVKMATAVVATGPIILLYPFVQKYFVKGLTVGAVKG